MTWLELLRLPEESFLKMCDVQSYLGSGKGGQKRNKTSNAIRIRYENMVATASSSRSKQLNLSAALQKLRFEIALLITEERLAAPSTAELLSELSSYVRGGGIAIHESNNLYPLMVGNVIDLFIFHRSWFGVAGSLQVSPTQIKKWVRHEHRLFKAIQSLMQPSNEGKSSELDMDGDLSE